VCRWGRLGVETDLLSGMCVGGTNSLPLLCGLNIENYVGD